jgi:hypothetical protein
MMVSIRCAGVMDALMQMVGRLPGGWSHVPHAVRLISLLLTNFTRHMMPPIVHVK